MLEDETVDAENNQKEETRENKISSKKITKGFPYMFVILIMFVVLGAVMFALLLKSSTASSLPSASLPPGGAAGGAAAANANAASLRLAVDIPCPGHAPLISGELKKIDGVIAVKFSWPNKFDVFYDTAKTSKQEIMGLEIFNEYPATAIPEL